MTTEEGTVMMFDPVAGEGVGIRGSTEYLAWESVDVCPMCKSADRSVVDTEASVVRCGGCGHRYVEPTPDPEGDRARVLVADRVRRLDPGRWLPSPGETPQFCRGLMGERRRIILAMPTDEGAVWTLTLIGNLIRRGLGRAPSRRYGRLGPGVESHIQHFDPRSITQLLSQCGLIVDHITVDDGSPQRSRLGVMAFALRRLLSRVTPWNFGREMLVIASRGL